MRSPEGGRLSSDAKPSHGPQSAEEVVEGLVVGEAESHQAKADNASDHEIMAAAFEVENGVDGENALEKGCRALEKLEWSYDNIPFFFNRCETRMAMHGVKKQYTKFQILSEILPSKVQEEVMPLIIKTETDFVNNDAYKQLKDEVYRIFGPRPQAATERALNRVLTGKPSTLARQLVNDLCERQLDSFGSQ